MNKRFKLDCLLGQRFKTLLELENKIKELSNRPNVLIYLDNETRLEGLDFIISGTLDSMRSEKGNGDFDFTLFYINDNQGNLYITEIINSRIN